MDIVNDSNNKREDFIEFLKSDAPKVINGKVIGHDITDEKNLKKKDTEMTDLDRFVQLLDEWEVGYVKDMGGQIICGESDLIKIILTADDDYMGEEEIEKQKEFCKFPIGNKIDGYCGFYSSFIFDSEGKFKSIGVYE